MLSLDDFQSLKRKVDKAKQLEAEIKGAKDQSLERLKRDHGFSSTRKAKVAIERKKKKVYKINRIYLKKMATFKKLYRKQLKALP